MKVLKKVLEKIRLVIASIALFLLGYYILAFFGSAISTTPIIEHPDIDIYILSNGVHTDIVVPTTNSTTDWETYFPLKNTSLKGATPKHIGLGWGSKAFYLETPTWNDLTINTAFKAVFGISKSAIHATYQHKMVPNNKDCFKISISQKQYKKLCAYIIKSLKIENNKSLFIKTDANYGPSDAFYEAVGSYNLFYTCNTWTNNALKTCDQRSALWTPSSKGILKHYIK